MMRSGLAVITLATAMGVGMAQETGLAVRVRQMEARGDSQGARQLLEQSLKSAPGDAATLAAYARFLDERRDPGARQAYQKLVEAQRGPAAAAAARRLAGLDLMAGDREAAARRLSQAGGGLSLPDAGAAGAASFIEIPGPLRSFARMAALSPDLAPEDTIAALARNIITNGFQAAGGSETLEQTEYLKLVFRYLSQARELTKLAGDAKAIRIETCESPQTADLLRTLGFRMRGGCGSEVVLETVNASRAFLTTDSGFPLAALEQALRTNRPFVYDYQPTRLPILYTPDYWLSAREKQAGEFIDAFLGDPSLCRLYLGVSKLDPETAEEMRKAMTAQRIRAFAHVFDFFGGMFRIRGGKAVVPGGAAAAPAWAELTGASPDQGVAFFERLVSRDDGWMASYFDSLSRISPPVLNYLTEPARMKRFYAAVRGRVTSPGPARPVFRSNTDLMLLTTRMRIGADGRPYVPGGVEVWKNLFINHPHGKYDGKLTRSATGWREPDDVIEALFGLSRKAVENEPLKIFLALSDLDRRRAQPLSAAAAERLARDYRYFGPQFTIFAESSELSDKTLVLYLDTADGINDIRDTTLRADSIGMLQSLAGIWQVLVRQGLIPAGQQDQALAALIEPFATARNQREVFDAGRGGVGVLLRAAGAPAGANPQERLVELLAGTTAPRDPDALAALVAGMNRGIESQRLLSLKTLFDLADHLESVSRGEKLNAALVNRLASRVSEVALPRAPLTAQEKNTYSFGYWVERHIDAQRRMNLRAAVERAAGSPERLREIRGQLTPVLRDTLVGLLYVHYAPPGAQVLYVNPLFVRSHDFIGIQGARQSWRGTEVLGSGWPSSAGGRLVGSLAALPYALAEAEQNFLIPTREQALIWGDLVPQMLVSARLPRFWNTTPAQLRWVNLHTRLAEAALAEASFSPALRRLLLDTLDEHAPPARTRKVNDLLAAAQPAAALEQITPAELYVLGRHLVAQKTDVAGGFAAAIAALAAAAPREVSETAISENFGTPKPTLANSNRPQLLHLRTFPTLMGYSSRIMAESWESNNLYFAALADDLSLHPAQLNVLIPEWTQKTVEQIFATHLEDWPALLRSMRVIGESVRTQTRKAASLDTKAELE